MLWIYSIAAVVLAVPGAMASILILVDRYRKRRSKHVEK